MNCRCSVSDASSRPSSSLNVAASRPSSSRGFATGRRSLRFSTPMRRARSAIATTGDRLWRARNQPPRPATTSAIGTT